MTRERVHAELADVVAGRRLGRTHDDEITVFDSSGTALEDVAAAIVVYEKASAMGRGVEGGSMTESSAERQASGPSLAGRKPLRPRLLPTGE